MKPIIEQNNVEIRETIQELFNKVEVLYGEYQKLCKEASTSISSSVRDTYSPLKPTMYGWSYNKNTEQYRYQPENGTTRFFQEKDLPEEGRIALGLPVNQEG